MLNRRMGIKKKWLKIKWWNGRTSAVRFVRILRTRRLLRNKRHGFEAHKYVERLDRALVLQLVSRRRWTHWAQNWEEQRRQCKQRNQFSQMLHAILSTMSECRMWAPKRDREWKVRKFRPLTSQFRS